jgi:hypothetical protein
MSWPQEYISGTKEFLLFTAPEEKKIKCFTVRCWGNLWKATSKEDFDKIKSTYPNVEDDNEKIRAKNGHKNMKIQLVREINGVKTVVACKQKKEKGIDIGWVCTNGEEDEDGKIIQNGFYTCLLRLVDVQPNEKFTLQLFSQAKEPGWMVRYWKMEIFSH